MASPLARNLSPGPENLHEAEGLLKHFHFLQLSSLLLDHRLPLFLVHQAIPVFVVIECWVFLLYLEDPFD